nr:hypothetical protein CFP56_11616 [Quercus suber]
MEHAGMYSTLYNARWLVAQSRCLHLEGEMDRARSRLRHSEYDWVSYVGRRVCYEFLKRIDCRDTEVMIMPPIRRYNALPNEMSCVPACQA